MAEPQLEAAPEVGEGGADSPATSLVRKPQQERSRRTLQRILDAGLHLLEHEGPDSLTVTGITKRARTSVGSFYARFQGKDDLLRYLGERSLNEALEVWAQLREGLGGDEALRTSVGEIVNRLGWLYLEGAGRSLVLLDGIEDAVPTRHRRLEARIAADLRELEVGPSIRADLATHVVTGILRDATVWAFQNDAGSEEDSPYPETATLLAELVEILVGYLGGEVQEATVPEPESTEPDTPIPASPEVEVRKPAESKRDIDTEALIEAALATEPLPQPATGEPAAVAEVTEDTGVTPVVPKEADEGELTPETALEPEPEPEPVPEQPQAGEEEDTEEASSPEPDPFDVWA